jgi:hypothetical protein
LQQQPDGRQIRVRASASQDGPIIEKTRSAVKEDERPRDAAIRLLTTRGARSASEISTVSPQRAVDNSAARYRR